MIGTITRMRSLASLMSLLSCTLGIAATVGCEQPPLFVGCSSDIECGTDQLCDPNNSICVPAECLIDADCGTAEVCDDGICVASASDIWSVGATLFKITCGQTPFTVSGGTWGKVCEFMCV